MSAFVSLLEWFPRARDLHHDLFIDVALAQDVLNLLLVELLVGLVRQWVGIQFLVFAANLALEVVLGSLEWAASWSLLAG